MKGYFGFGTLQNWDILEPKHFCMWIFLTRVTLESVQVGLGTLVDFKPGTLQTRDILDLIDFTIGVGQVWETSVLRHPSVTLELLKCSGHFSERPLWIWDVSELGHFTLGDFKPRTLQTRDILDLNDFTIEVGQVWETLILRHPSVTLELGHFCLGAFGLRPRRTRGT